MNAVIAKSALMLTLAAAFVGYSVLAHADRVDRAMGSVPSITISFGELDLSKPQGLEVLYTRIKRAAKSVCGFKPSPLTTLRRRDASSCYESTVEHAVKQVNRPMLTALHRARTKSAFG
jgi:UrcA family protein